MDSDKLSVYSVTAELGNARLRFYRVGKPGLYCDNDAKSSIGPNHSHLYYECHYIDSGSLEFELENGKVRVDGGRVLLIPPFVEHYPLGGINTGYRVISFTIERKEGETGFYESFVSSIDCVSCRLFEAGAELVRALKLFPGSFSAKTPADYCNRKILAYQLTKELFASIKGFDFALKNNAQNGANVDIALLDYLVNENSYSLSDIAGQIGYTARHTARLIRQLYQKSLGEIRLGNMTETAKKLLEKSDLGLGRIAESVGFSSLAVMNRVFFKSEGVYPSQYRNAFRRSKD